MIDDPPTILRFRVPGLPGRVWLMDSRNWGIEPPEDLPSAAAEAEWLASAMRRMVDTLHARGWGGLKATAGSQALATWRRAFMTHQVVAHNDDDVLRLEALAYVGGRCECGRLGDVPGPLYQVDRRSAYAHAMREVDVPVAIRSRTHDDGKSIYRDPGLARRSVATVRVRTDHPSYPCPTQDGVRYPVGRYTCTLAGPELADAIARDVVCGVGECVEYECAPALRAYADALWDARRSASGAQDAAVEGWLKRLLVGLPGKFGQRLSEWSSDSVLVPPAPWCAWWGVDRQRQIYRLRALGGAVQRQHRSTWTYDAVPAIACWIMSAARLELLRAIRLCGWPECVYWDTDSLLLTQQGYDRLAGSPAMMGDDLGQWRLVKTATQCVVRGIKHYVLDGVVTCAGCPKGDQQATRLLDRYWYRQSFGMALNERHAPGAARRLRPYARVAGYRAGRLGDGGIVHPHYVEEW